MSKDYYDFEKLSIEELLARSLQESPTSSAVRAILFKINKIEELLHITIEELEEEGLQTKPAESFLAGIELVKRIYASPSRIKEKMSSPDVVGAYLVNELRYKDREHFVVLYLDRKGGLISKEAVSVGGLQSSIVHPREVFKTAVKRSAASIILAHNHPSGDPAPSQEDIAVTQRLVSAGEIMGIPIIDHIVLGDCNWVSMKQLNHIK